MAAVAGVPARRTVIGAAGLGITSLTLPGAWAAASTIRTLGLEDSPAPSATALLEDGWTTDGWYWIGSAGMGTARRVWCDLTDEGGGWMLVAYTPDLSGVESTAAGLPYPNAWQGGEGTLDRMTAATMDLWAPGGTVRCDSVLKMASTVAGRPPRLGDMQIANRVTYTNPEALDMPSGVTYARQVLPALDGTWYPVKGHTVMSEPLTVNAPMDWIFTASSTWTPCAPSTGLADTYGRSGNGQGTGSYTSPTTASLYGMKDVAEDVSSLRTDLRSYAVLIR